MAIRRVYLDYSATTFVREEVLAEMRKYFSVVFGNPSSLHSFGREARIALDDSREKIAECLQVKPTEIVFTSGGSEADNLAIKGTAWHLKEKGNHIITSQIEHHAVLNTCKWLERQGFRVTYLPVDGEGFVNLDILKKEICEETILISIMAGNNEVGTIQNIAEIARIAKGNGVRFHTDAVQFACYMDLKLAEIPIDMASFSSHKFYGPKGVGFLFLREGCKIEPLLHGGSQEWEKRAGTENLAGIVGMAKAFQLATSERKTETPRLIALRDKLIDGILSRVENAKVNGARVERLPNNANIAFLGLDAEQMLVQLDMEGIAASSGSACASGSTEPSHVLLAMGVEPEEIRGSIRFSLGLKSDTEQIDFLLNKISEIVERQRRIHSVVL